MSSASLKLTLYFGRHSSPRSGMWIYSRALLEALLQYSESLKIHCLLGGSEEISFELASISKRYPERLSFELLAGGAISRRSGILADLFRACSGELVHGTSNMLPLRGWGKRILTLHDLLQAFPVLEKQTLYQQLRARFYRSYLKQLLPGIDLLITDLPVTRSMIQARFKISCPVAVVYPGLDPVYLADRAPVQVSGSKILALANRDPRKNIYRAIQAFARLPAGSASLCLLASDRQLANQLIEYAQSLGLRNVECQVALAQESMPDLYRSARIVLFPSLAEGFGYPIYEALSQGTICVFSKGLLIPELESRLGTFCFECQPDSIESISEALQRALASAPEQSERDVVSQQVRSLLNFETTAKKLLELYRSL